MTVPEVIQACKSILEGHYGSHLAGLVLYGSVARGQGTPASDIDLLVLLKHPFDYFDELRTIVDLLYRVQLESDWLISAKPVPLKEYEEGRIQLYRNAKREGVLV